MLTIISREGRDNVSNDENMSLQVYYIIYRVKSSVSSRPHASGISRKYLAPLYDRWPAYRQPFSNPRQQNKILLLHDSGPHVVDAETIIAKSPTTIYVCSG